VSEASALPPVPGDRIRREPYALYLRTQYASKAWREVATPYAAAARAWRAELRGRTADCGRVADFAAWRRLRLGQPSTFQAYDEARCRVLNAPTSHAENLAAKIQIVAEMLGLMDPREVMHPFARSPGAEPTRADLLMGALWRDAHNVARRFDDLKGSR
jgi:hypothetical protein